MEAASNLNKTQRDLHGHRTRFGDAGICNRVFGNIAQKDADAIAGGHADAGKRVGEAVGEITEFVEADAAIAGDHRGLCAEPARGRARQVADDARHFRVGRSGDHPFPGFRNQALSGRKLICSASTRAWLRTSSNFRWSLMLPS